MCKSQERLHLLHSTSCVEQLDTQRHNMQRQPAYDTTPSTLLARPGALDYGADEHADPTSVV